MCVPSISQFANPQTHAVMNTMLELSKDADYDTFAAFTIIAFAIVARFWPAIRRHLKQGQI
jgi:hypothetical protein